MENLKELLVLLKEKGFIYRKVSSNLLKVWVSSEKAWLNYYPSTRKFHFDGRPVIGRTVEEFMEFVSKIGSEGFDGSTDYDVLGANVDKALEMVYDLSNILESIRNEIRGKMEGKNE